MQQGTTDFYLDKGCLQYLDICMNKTKFTKLPEPRKVTFKNGWEEWVTFNTFCRCKLNKNKTKKGLTTINHSFLPPPPPPLTLSLSFSPHQAKKKKRKKRKKQFSPKLTSSCPGPSSPWQPKMKTFFLRECPWKSQYTWRRHAWWFVITQSSLQWQFSDLIRKLLFFCI